MKAWLLMVALVDWAYDKETEDERASAHRSSKDMGWHEISGKLRKTQANRRAVKAYKLRTNIGPFEEDIDSDLPESAILEFPTWWQAGNYVHMAKLAVNLVGKPVSKLAGDLRAAGEFARLVCFELREVRQLTGALAEADVYMEGTAPKGSVRGVFRVRAHRCTEEGEVAMRADSGRWHVRQSCMVDLREGRTIVEPDA